MLLCFTQANSKYITMTYTHDWNFSLVNFLLWKVLQQELYQEICDNYDLKHVLLRPNSTGTSSL